MKTYFDTHIELWRLQRDGKEVVCTVNEIRDATRAAWDAAPLGFELCVERDGELYLTELRAQREAIDTRSEQMREALIEKGWR